MKLALPLGTAHSLSPFGSLLFISRAHSVVFPAGKLQKRIKEKNRKRFKNKLGCVTNGYKTLSLSYGQSEKETDESGGCCISWASQSLILHSRPWELELGIAWNRKPETKEGSAINFPSCWWKRYSSRTIIFNVTSTQKADLKKKQIIMPVHSMTRRNQSKENPFSKSFSKNTKINARC